MMVWVKKKYEKGKERVQVPPSECMCLFRQGDTESKVMHRGALGGKLHTFTFRRCCGSGPFNWEWDESGLLKTERTPKQRASWIDMARRGASFCGSCVPF